MIHALRQEVNSWKFKRHLCEENSLNGIKHLSQRYNSKKYKINSSFPIKEGISLIYFIGKDDASHDLTFGSKQVEWTYHCCIGFKDIRFDKDWFIDLSYHCMVRDLYTGTSREVRMIRKDQYLANIPRFVFLNLESLSLR